MHSLPKDTGAVIFSLPRGVPAWLPRPFRRRDLRQDLAALFHVLPADFRQACRRVVRASRRAPSRSSSCRMCLPTITGEMRKASAAAVKLPGRRRRQNFHAAQLIHDVRLQTVGW
jgi:hypothetical protein